MFIMPIKTIILLTVFFFINGRIKAQEKIAFSVNKDSITVLLIEDSDQPGVPGDTAYYVNSFELELTLTNLSCDTLMIPPGNSNSDHVLLDILPLNGWQIYSSVTHCGLIFLQDQVLLPGQTGKVSLSVDGFHFRKRGTTDIFLEPMVYKKDDEKYSALIPVKKQKVTVIIK
jgi:hypothetical protein